jgi:hypothetical protein
VDIARTRARQRRSTHSARPSAPISAERSSSHITELLIMPPVVAAGLGFVAEYRYSGVMVQRSLPQGLAWPASTFASAATKKKHLRSSGGTSPLPPARRATGIQVCWDPKPRASHLLVIPMARGGQRLRRSPCDAGCPGSRLPGEQRVHACHSMSSKASSGLATARPPRLRTCV